MVNEVPAVSSPAGETTSMSSGAFRLIPFKSIRIKNLWLTRKFVGLQNETNMAEVADTIRRGIVGRNIHTAHVIPSLALSRQTLCIFPILALSCKHHMKLLALKKELVAEAGLHSVRF